MNREIIGIEQAEGQPKIWVTTPDLWLAELELNSLKPWEYNKREV